MEKETKAIHTPFQKRDAYGALSFPVYNTVAYEFDSIRYGMRMIVIHVLLLIVDLSDGLKTVLVFFGKRFTFIQKSVNIFQIALNVLQLLSDCFPCPFDRMFPGHCMRIWKKSRIRESTVSVIS